MRRRFFADAVEGGAAPARASVRGANAEHLTRVLRAQPGQHYELAHQGRVYLGEIQRVSRDEVCFTILEEVPPPAPRPGIDLAAALFKFDRFEWMLEKATELGVAAVHPLTTRRTDPRLAAAAGRRSARWRAILLESAQQSRRVDCPALHPCQTLAAFLAAPPPQGGQPPRQRCLLSELPGGPAFQPRSEPLLLLTGPEGGWTLEEIAAAQTAGFASVSLGPLVLRCETAVLAALARAAV